MHQIEQGCVEDKVSCLSALQLNGFSFSWAALFMTYKQRLCMCQ